MFKNYRWPARLKKKFRLKNKLPLYISVYDKSMVYSSNGVYQKIKLSRKKNIFFKKSKIIWFNII